MISLDVLFRTCCAAAGRSEPVIAPENKSYYNQTPVPMSLSEQKNTPRENGKAKWYHCYLGYLSSHQQSVPLIKRER